MKEPAPRSELRIPFETFLKRYGRTRATGHRWRRLLPWMDVLNIFGPLHQRRVDSTLWRDGEPRRTRDTHAPTAAPRPQRQIRETSPSGTG